MRVPVVRSVLAGALVFAAWASGPLAADTANQVCEPTCEDRCRTKAAELFRTCIAAGGDPTQCAERARTALAACVEENCRPDPTCEVRCRAEAEEFLRACIESGNDPEVCAESARAVLAVCIEEHCLPDPTCEDRCRAHADDLNRACVASGVDPALCAEQSLAVLEACLRDSCDLCLCPDIYEPVCGVDGKTYGNACLARCAHVEVAYAGECRVACDCNANCPSGSICHDGVCRAPCLILCIVEDPVCGSDGRTYFCGEVDAACHGVKVLHKGECGKTCRVDADCPVGGLCTAPRDCPDACGCASFCQPCACPRIYEPVCGVNGRTYANPCLARCARVQVAYSGACRVTRSLN